MKFKIFSGEKKYQVSVYSSFDEVLHTIKARVAEFQKDDARYRNILLSSWVTDVDYSKIKFNQNIIKLTSVRGGTTYLNGVITITVIKKDEKCTLLHCFLTPKLNALYIFLTFLCIFITYTAVIQYFFFGSNVWRTVGVGLAIISVVLLQIQYVLSQLKSYLINFLSTMEIKSELLKL
jgi:hypothetical protein